MAANEAKPVSLYLRLGVCLFGLVFFGAGLLAGYFFVLSDARDWFAARGYTPVPAQLIRVDVQRHASSKSTTYRVRAAYLYTFGGREYVGERVAISDVADNIGDYQQALYAQLAAARRDRRDVTAWVNPSDPRASLLDRDMRWDLFALKSVFFLVFTLIGGGIAYAALSKRVPPLAASPNAIPMQPSGRIASNLQTAPRFWWSFAIFWNLISTPLLLFVPRELAKGNWAVLAILLFTVAGVWLIYQALHASLQRHRFGVLTLVLAPYPGAIGGAVHGAVDLPERFHGREIFRAKLTCVRRRVTRSGRDRTTTDNALWQSEARVDVDTSGHGTRLSFGFDVPAGLPPSEAPSDNYVFWTIVLAADIPGVNLDCSFETPMVEAADAPTPVAAPLRAAAAAPTPSEIPAGIVHIGRSRDAAIFYYPPFRSPAIGFALLLFSALAGGAAAFMVTQAHGGLAAVGLWFMIGVFGLVSAGILLLALYVLVNTLRVEVSARDLTSVRRVFGIRVERRAALADIASIQTRIGSQSGAGGNINVRYALVAHTRDGREIAVGDDVPGSTLANELARRIAEACGLHAGAAADGAIRRAG